MRFWEHNARSLTPTRALDTTRARLPGFGMTICRDLARNGKGHAHLKNEAFKFNAATTGVPERAGVARAGWGDLLSNALAPAVVRIVVQEIAPFSRRSAQPRAAVPHEFSKVQGPCLAPHRCGEGCPARVSASAARGRHTSEAAIKLVHCPGGDYGHSIQGFYQFSCGVSYDIIQQQ